MNDTLLLAKDSLFTTNPYLTNITIAIIIFIIGLILGGLAGKFIHKIFKNFDDKLKKKTGFKYSVISLISALIQVSIYLLFTVLALNYVGITSLLLNILFIAIILILSISFILALKDSLPNIIAGWIIKRKNLINIDTKISLENINGKIVDMNIFEVRIEAKNGDILHIPNSLFMKTKYVKKKN